MCSQPEAGFVVRTITAGVSLDGGDDLGAIATTADFLAAARGTLESAGLPVQSTRIATQPLAGWLRDLGWNGALESLRRLDRLAHEQGSLISIGPLGDGGYLPADFPVWAAELAAATQDLYFSLAVATPTTGISAPAARSAARAIVAISQVGGDGEANFRFAAAACVPPATPFFPVAYHAGPPTFSIGLESAGLVAEAVTEAIDFNQVTEILRDLLETRLRPVEMLATEIAATHSWRYGGIDLSPAPSVETSIAGPVEALSGRRFGGPKTLAACAAITRAVQSTALRSCGYSGLMLPLLEDRVLAQRAAQGCFGVRDLLLLSSVCGTGLDVIPLPGDCSEDDLADLILDMAALARRWSKPLAARLLPIPGRSAGDRVEFSNPHLTSSIVLPVR